MPLGALGFYCRVLRLLQSVKPSEKDQLVVVLAELLEFCVNREFGKILCSGLQEEV